jgi:predicted outer membrane repeat protein
MQGWGKGFASLLALVIGCSVSPVLAKTVWYVDADATGANDGTSWDDAFTELQSAFAAAEKSDEVWVAAGTYKPDYDPVTGMHTGDRSASFVPPPVYIYGGFVGGETSTDQADPLANETILSGDIGVVGDAGDNSYHVIRRVDEIYHGAVVPHFNGFTITGGRADGPSDRNGGGVHGTNFSGGFTRCRFLENYAVEKGGAIYLNSGSVQLYASSFVANEAGEDGGGVFA